MRDRDGERGFVVAEARQQYPAAGDAARQGVVDDLDRFQLAQQAIGAGGDATDTTVGLVAPVVEAATLGQVVRLVGEPRAQAAGVALVEADDVVFAGQLRDGVQAQALAHRQHVRPAAGGVVAVATRARAGLDVGAQQFQAAMARGLVHAHRRVRVRAQPPRAARSFASRCVVMRSMSSMVLPVTRYLPSTMMLGLPSTPVCSTNWAACFSWASVRALVMALANCVGSTPNRP